MSAEIREDESGSRPESAARERRIYLLGYALALVLTLVPFALVAWDLADRGTILIGIGIAALLQVVVHFRCFLHIRFQGQSREDLQLILFTTLILVIMIGGTIFILANQAARMM
ncbi:cytochrome o ubiquinol oxidase subunit IV [Pseudoroseicyclus sp. H15]